jgi:CheY-like chemotaxis protein
MEKNDIAHMSAGSKERVLRQSIVLAVDDMVFTLNAVKVCLKGYFDVVIAKSARDALKILPLAHVDIILLDIEMPEMSGLNFFAQLKKDPAYSKTPVIFLTSNAQSEIIKSVVLSGAKDYIVKPFSQDLLVKKIETALARSPDLAAGELMDKLMELKALMAKGDDKDIKKAIDDIAPEKYIPSIAQGLSRLVTCVRDKNFDLALRQLEQLRFLLK